MLGTCSVADEATKDAAAAKAEGYPLVPVGAATIDITPSYPTRMSGYGARVKEHESVAMPIHAKGSPKVKSGAALSVQWAFCHQIRSCSLSKIRPA